MAGVLSSRKGSYKSTISGTLLHDWDGVGTYSDSPLLAAARRLFESLEHAAEHVLGDQDAICLSVSSSRGDRRNLPDMMVSYPASLKISGRAATR